MIFLFKAIVFQGVIQTIVCSYLYMCGDGEQELKDVFDNYGPLCNKENDCNDASDELFCNPKKTENYPFYGCWSQMKSTKGNAFKITDCQNCLCPANSTECQNNEGLNIHCDYCITDDNLIGDTVNDCLFGIDETSDIKMVRIHHPTRYRQILSRAIWKCRDPNSPNQIKQCSFIFDKKKRIPFLFQFLSDNEKENSCSIFPNEEELNFWLCDAEEDGVCLRNGFPCTYGSTYPKCQDGYGWIPQSKECKKSTCPDTEWFCTEESVCKDESRPCGNSNSCLPMRQYCSSSNTCDLEGKSACTSTTTFPTTTSTTTSTATTTTTKSSTTIVTEPSVSTMLKPSTATTLITTSTTLTTTTTLITMSTPLTTQSTSIQSSTEDSQFGCKSSKWFCEEMQECLNIDEPCNGRCPKNFFFCYVAESRTESCLSYEQPCAGNCTQGMKLCAVNTLCYPEANFTYLCSIQNTRIEDEKERNKGLEIWPWVFLGCSLLIFVVVVVTLTCLYRRQKKALQNTEETTRLRQPSISLNDLENNGQ